MSIQGPAEVLEELAEMNLESDQELDDEDVYSWPGLMAILKNEVLQLNEDFAAKRVPETGPVLLAISEKYHVSVNVVNGLWMPYREAYLAKHAQVVARAAESEARAKASAEAAAAAKAELAVAQAKAAESEARAAASQARLEESRLRKAEIEKQDAEAQAKLAKSEAEYHQAVEALVDSVSAWENEANEKLKASVNALSAHVDNRAQTIVLPGVAIPARAATPTVAQVNQQFSQMRLTTPSPRAITPSWNDENKAPEAKEAKSPGKSNAHQAAPAAKKSGFFRGFF